MTTDRERHMSGFADAPDRMSLQAFSRPGIAESWAKHSATSQEGIRHESASNRDPLGKPLSIREVAELIGCSAWTVRQRHIPRGLPCFRSGPAGKIHFYRNQVVAWILRQQKGGK